jgi:hypothetical protein
MTSVKTKPKKQQSSSHRQKQERKHFEDIGTLQAPLRQNRTKPERESLSDWEDAT